ncbi:MAG: YihY/virulence factor BrkB family protein [Acidimicrobiales bacterium]
MLRAMAHEWREDRVSGLAAEIAFFGVLSVFPGLLALAAGLGSLEAIVGQEVAAETERVVLDALRDSLGERSPTVEAVHSLFTEQNPGLLTFGLILALLGMSRGFGAVIRALDVAYDVEERRPWLHRRLMAVGLALGSLVIAVVLLAVLVLGPLLGGGRDVAEALGLGQVFATGWTWLRWPFALLALLAWAVTLLHLAPNHRTPWRWDVPGAVLAASIWIATSVGFRAFLAVAGEGNQVFGALGGALTLLFWLYLLGIGLVLGGELNAVLAARHGMRQELRV